MASVSAHVVTARKVTVNTKTVGNTVLIDPVARFWVTVALGYRVVASSGITVPANVTVGSEDPTYQNAGTDDVPINPDGAKAGIVWVNLPAQAGYLAYCDLTTSGLKVRVGTAATGTSQSVEIIVVGYYV